MIDETKYPNFLKRVYICFFKKRKEWRKARSASILLSWAWSNGTDDEFVFLKKLEDKLWRNVYEQ